MSRVLVIFLDGVGLGENDAQINPLCNARLHTFEELLGTRPLAAAAPTAGRGAALLALDATLGVPGLPQSGTGQTTLLTGINAAREFGRHFGPWVPTALRERLARDNILSRAGAHGLNVAFANAYPEEVFETTTPAERSGARGRSAADPLRAGPPIAAIGAGVLNRRTPELQRGDAVASEITNEGWRKHLGRSELPVIHAQEAGRNLARIAGRHDLTLFAHYSTDYIGHRGHMWEAVQALEKVDDFLAGVLAAISSDTTVFLVSDHGNLEDIRVGHTYNPALAIVAGARFQEASAGMLSLSDIAPRVLHLLGI